MVKHKLGHDTSKELLISRFEQGLKLIKPNQVSELENNPFSFYVGQTVSNLLAAPFSVYFLNAQGEGQNINQQGLVQCRIQSTKDIYGKTIEHFVSTETAGRALANTKEVLISRKTKIFDETVTYKDETFIQTIAIKTPWYSEENKIIGVIGCSIDLKKYSLAESLTIAESFGLLGGFGININHQKKEFENIYLSQRERACLHLYIQGKTAKQSAQVLHLSYRTVENYLQNIKVKFNVSTKSELILKGMRYFQS